MKCTRWLTARGCVRLVLAAAALGSSPAGLGADLQGGVRIHDPSTLIRCGERCYVFGTGPYLDRTGKDLHDGGGTLFLGTTGRYIGPGHMGIFDDRATNWFSYHFYDADRGGRPTLAVRRLGWSEDGWPAPTGH